MLSPILEAYGNPPMHIPSGLVEEWERKLARGTFASWRGLAIQLFDLATVYAREGLTEIARDTDFLSGVALEHGYSLKPAPYVEQN
jgi:hypothetical protein